MPEWEPIISYSLFCALNQEQAHVVLFVGSKKQQVQVQAASLAHFQAMAAILQNERPVYFNAVERLLGTGEEPPGGSTDQGPY